MDPEDDQLKDWRQYSIPEELELQMSPNMWNPVKTAEQVKHEFYGDIQAGTELAQRTLPVSLNISYGQLPSEKYDLYGCDLADDAPILLWSHGGYWQEGRKEISGSFAPLAHRVGVKTVVLGYTLAPAATIGQMEEELIMALQCITKSYPKAKVIIGGHSTGAQLSASILHSSCASLTQVVLDQVVGLVLISGVYEVEPVIHTYANEPLKLSREEAIAHSPLCQTFNPYVNLTKLGILVIVGGHDPPEFRRQSASYFQKLKQEAQKSAESASQEHGAPELIFHKSATDDHFTLFQNLGKEEPNTTGAILRKFLQGFLQL